jgi:hypothetical protein
VLFRSLVQDVMASDGVDPAELQASLSEIAGDIRRRRSSSRQHRQAA